MMTSPNEKSPVSLLQEWCAKKSTVPVYEVTESSNSHPRTFVCKLVFNEDVFCANASSKKKAKQESALLALNKISTSDKTNFKLKSQKDTESTNRFDKNYVGELHEITQKRLLPPPKFEFRQDAKSKHFFCTVNLMQLSMCASGPSRKLSKRNACKRMLEELKIEDLNTSLKQTGISSNTENALSRTSSSEGPVFKPTLKHDIKLSLLQPTRVTSQSYLKMMEDLARIHKFEIINVNISELNSKGAHQCLLQISIHPVMVFKGTGTTKDEAYSDALVNAFGFLHNYMAKLNY